MTKYIFTVEVDKKLWHEKEFMKSIKSKIEDIIDDECFLHDKHVPYSVTTSKSVT